MIMFQLKLRSTIRIVIKPLLEVFPIFGGFEVGPKFF